VPGFDTITYGEIVNPPCNIASYFANFVLEHGGAYNNYSSSQAGEAIGSDIENCFDNTQQKIVPKNLPLGWDPRNPQYWVHAGLLFFEPGDTFQASIRISLAIAADFKAEVVSEGPGLLTQPQTCTLLVDTGSGTVTVGIINTGSQLNDYIVMTNCSQGIYADPNGVPAQVFPGYGGVDSAIKIPISVHPDTVYATAACTVSLYPSVGAKYMSSPLDTTDPPIPCVAALGLPVVKPDSGPGYPVDEIGQYVPWTPGSGCHGFGGCVAHIFHHNHSMFTSAQIFVLTTILLIAIMLTICGGVMSATASVQKMNSRMRGVVDAMQESNIAAGSLALYLQENDGAQGGNNETGKTDAPKGGSSPHEAKQSVSTSKIPVK
jgi:hypothetical protein